MRTRTTLIAAGLLATLTACGGDPAYTVVDVRDSGIMRTADLQQPDATRAEAEQAIRDYADTIEGPKWATVTLYSDLAEGELCRGIWVKDQETSEKLSGGSFTSDTWPALRVQCP
ncbi:hypothetical protein [Streptomyces genisteinicus]|uniref:Lipoprotein n=1 Tax=Streptomyces genisteinicus TaxID=2768068 RepID=A0A7H0HYY1_9ACTN|nr:hypothetical protein [Streptomyces genisteinicus]QNP65747.1 hypothetical protein IAG43_24305 [Streptomyces genisteinicus]